MPIQFKADQIRLQTMVDGGFKITFMTGEYSASVMKDIIGLPKGIYNVEITPDIQ